MNDQYEAMRDAAISLINTVTDNGNSPNVKIGLVPFARYVHGTLDGSYVLGGTAGVPWTNCTTGRKWPWVWKDDTPTAAEASKWGRLGNDSLGDIEGDPDYYEDCQEMADENLTIRPLSIDHAGTIAQLNAMSPWSGTNVAVGVEYGYHVLSPNLPWDEGVAYNDGDWRKIMILLTDGRHNKSGFGPGGIYTEDQGYENVDLICDRMKQDGIMVITIAYDLDDDEGKDQMQRCASSSQYYLEGDEDNIASVFEGVGNLLAETIFLSK